MITDEKAYEMMVIFHQLRKLAEKTKKPADILKYERYVSDCLERLRYFVQHKTYRYAKFANYEDLNQEGMMALLKAMQTFDPAKKRSFFYWASLFVKTRVSRSANSHAVIRFPMHVAKQQKPHREVKMPLLFSSDESQEEAYEQKEIRREIMSAIATLPKPEAAVVTLYYGLDGEEPMSITGISRRTKMNHVLCVQALERAVETLGDRIEL